GRVNRSSDRKTTPVRRQRGNRVCSRAKAKCLRANRFSSRAKVKCLRANRFSSRAKVKCLRANRFSSRAKVKCSRANRFCSRAKAKCSRGKAISRLPASTVNYLRPGESKTLHSLVPFGGFYNFLQKGRPETHSVRVRAPILYGNPIHRPATATVPQSPSETPATSLFQMELMRV